MPALKLDFFFYVIFEIVDTPDFYLHICLLCLYPEQDEVSHD